MTYPVGAIIAIVAIAGDMEKSEFLGISALPRIDFKIRLRAAPPRVWAKPSAILLSLYYIELLLKARGKLRPEGTAKSQEDSSLAVRDKVYSIPHIAILFLRKIKGRAYEYEVVAVVLLLQAVVALFTLFSFYRS